MEVSVLGMFICSLFTFHFQETNNKLGLKFSWIIWFICLAYSIVDLHLLYLSY